MRLLTLTILFTVPFTVLASTLVNADAKPRIVDAMNTAVEQPTGYPLGEAAIRKAMGAMSPGTRIDAIRPTPVAGLMEVDVPNDLIYVSSDGKYLLTGKIIDTATHRDLTEASRAVQRHTLLRGISASQMIVFAPSHPKYTVSVFTDLDCGFCRKMHSQIADYNKEGIAVDYLFYPREGIGSESYEKAVSVWCATDRPKAFTDAKKGLPVANAHCTNPVAQDYTLGRKAGVDGTPSVYAADGTQIGGYVSPTEMRAKLDKLAEKPNS